MPAKRFIPPRTRPSARRDAKLIIIAAEGTKTEKRYFDDLASFCDNPRIHVEVLERLNAASAPAHVLAQLDAFCRRYAIRRRYDELWLVIDVDRWGERNLSDVSTLCGQKHYFLAISNPCFELWLLLHLRSLESYEIGIQDEFRLNRSTGNRTRLDIEIVHLLGSYNKSDLDTTPFLPLVRTAIDNARQCDLHPEHRWPNDLGTRVYLLAEKIVAP